jgi:hypothetical protein
MIWANTGELKMDQEELTRRKRAEVDVWDGMLRQKTREYERQGMPLEQAEEKASADIRREIRRS